MITVFTPTYNRAYILGRLYKSLCAQDYSDFEWLIVDDGSNDNTAELVRNFQKEQLVKIRYYKVKNGGKHLAINYAVKKAEGEAFYIVDSDDVLPKEALSTISQYFYQIVDNKEFAGVSGFRINSVGDKIGGGRYSLTDTDTISIREKYHVKGDMAEVYKTAVLKQFGAVQIFGVCMRQG